MRSFVRFTAVGLLTLIPLSAFAALSAANASFGSGPAQFLMTKDEQKQWKEIKTDADAAAFIAAFWARRDPTPGTPANEYFDEYLRRVETANQNFARAKTIGSMTDQGKIMVVLGPPTKIQRTNPEPRSTVQTPNRTLRPLSESENSVQGYSGKQLWTYEQAKVPMKLGQPVVEIVFVDQYGSQEWKLDRSPRTNVGALLDRINQEAIVQPTATGAPVAAATVTTVAAATAAAPTSAVTTSALAAAVRAAKPGKPLFVSYGEFITPAGDYYVPVQLLAPKESGFTADQDVTFFGELTDADGKIVASFEETARFTESKNDHFFARTLIVPAGNYKGRFAVVQSGTPVAVATSDLALQPLDKAAPSLSRLMLANNVYALSAAQAPTDPFAFGGVKVVPKSDLNFTPADELWYFFEVRNPGLDTATNAPKLITQVTLSGKRTDGKPVKMQGPSEEAVVQELKGVTGHYGVGAAIPLETFKPGEYTIKIKVTDTVTNQSYNLEQNFRISGASS